MRHQPSYRAMHKNPPDLWSVGCTCGWLCDQPLRGDKERARRTWRAHRADIETQSIARLMTSRPEAAKPPRRLAAPKDVTE